MNSCSNHSAITNLQEGNAKQLAALEAAKNIDAFRSQALLWGALGVCGLPMFRLPGGAGEGGLCFVFLAGLAYFSLQSIAWGLREVAYVCFQPLGLGGWLMFRLQAVLGGLGRVVVVVSQALGLPP